MPLTAMFSDVFQCFLFNFRYGSFLPLVLASRLWCLCSLNSLVYLNSFCRWVGWVLIIYMFVLQLKLLFPSSHGVFPFTIKDQVQAGVVAVSVAIFCCSSLFAVGVESCISRACVSMARCLGKRRQICLVT